MQSLNTIFYGPPGTGKTYLTSQRALQLIENLSDSEFQKKYPTDQRAKLKSQYREYQQQGRVSLLTFHPSFAYEDFVEGIKPFKNEKNDLYYDIVDGVFKQMCYNAAYALYLAQQKRALNSLSKPRGKVTKSLPLRPFDALYFEFIDYLKRMMQEGSEDITFETKKGRSYQLNNINQNSTLAFQTSANAKVYSVTKQNLAKLYQAFPSAESIEQLSEIVSVVGRVNTSVMWAAFNRLKSFEKTRYQTYNSLLSNYQVVGNSVSAVQYQQMKQGILQLDYTTLTSSDYKEAGNFVLIIDEINRGNPASIFGELISLIEEDKRAGKTDALQTILPYSREPFQVPPNVYIIGTMNSADRSVDTLDMAFRRRFTFQAFQPNPNLLKPAVTISLEESASNESLTQAAEPQSNYIQHKVYLDQLLETLNNRLLWLKGEDYQLGHAFFLPVIEANDALGELQKAIYQQVIPLLEEYFFDDWEKRISVLSPAFVEESPRPNFSEESSSFNNQPLKQYRWRVLDDREFISAIKEVYQHE